MEGSKSDRECMKRTSSIKYTDIQLKVNGLKRSVGSKGDRRGWGFGRKGFHGLSYKAIPKNKLDCKCYKNPSLPLL